VIGGIIGALIVPIIKFIFMAIATFAVLISFFMMLPSFLFDNSKATAERILLEDSYNAYYESMEGAYRDDIVAQVDVSRITTGIISAIPMAMAELGDTSLLYQSPAEYPYVKLSEADIARIDNAIDEFDEVDFESVMETLHTVDEYVESVSSNINLVMCLIDVHKDNWFISIFDGLAETVTGGHYGRFIDWIGKKWDGFWNDFIAQDLYSITVKSIEDVTPEPDPDEDEDDEEDEEDEEEEEVKTVAKITIAYTWDFKDKGVGFYADKLNLSPEQIDKATEMSYYLSDLFGTFSDMYFGTYVKGGYHTGAVQGGSVAINIEKGLERFAEEVEGMVFSPGSTPQVFPLIGYSRLPLASAFGPRDFPPDPYHTGIDFSVPAGTPIRPISDGLVLALVQSPASFGNHVIVFHGYYGGKPVCTMYAHMSAFGSFEAGDRVSAGNVIGYVGRTGLSTGNHLHFEYLEDGQRYNPVAKLKVFEYLKPS
jgi:murein DD-endopeptidase MepM/ murein hydrolase activator NlpD